MGKEWIVLLFFTLPFYHFIEHLHHMVFLRSTVVYISFEDLVFGGAPKLFVKDCKSDRAKAVNMNTM